MSESSASKKSTENKEGFINRYFWREKKEGNDTEPTAPKEESKDKQPFIMRDFLHDNISVHIDNQEEHEKKVAAKQAALEEKKRNVQESGGNPDEVKADKGKGWWQTFRDSFKKGEEKGKQDAQKSKFALL